MKMTKNKIKIKNHTTLLFPLPVLPTSATFWPDGILMSNPSKIGTSGRDG
jgi:hypothetical protein